MNGKLVRAAALAGALGAALLALSCASRTSSPQSLAAEMLLPQNAYAYARLDSAFLKDTLPFFASIAQDQGGFKGGVKPFLDRTSTLYIAFTPAFSGSPTGFLFALARGNYPGYGMEMALALDKSWEKRGKEWVFKPSPLFLTGIDTNTLLLGTAPLGNLSSMVNASLHPSAKTAGTKQQTQNPIPESWRKVWDSPFALYIRKPAQNLQAGMPLDDVNLPLLSMIVSGTGPEKSAYAMYMSFEFDSDTSALMFSPLCRLMLYGAAHKLWPQKAATILDDAIWRIDSRFVSVAGFRLDAADIAAFAGLLH